MGASRRTLGATLVALLFLAPLTFLLSGAFREPGLLPTDTFALVPDPVTTAALERAFDLVRLGRLLLNSVVVAAIAVPLAVLVASWAGFAMVMLPDRQRRLAVGLSLVLLMVPLAALWLPRFVMFRSLGFVDTWVPLIAPALLGMSPFYVLLFYWAFSRVPSELFEAARLEGASALRVWAWIAMPLARPAILTVAVLSLVLYWSNYLDPLLYLNRQENYTLPVGIQALHQMHPTAFPLLMAGAVLITLPVIFLFLIAQRHFLQETRGAGWLGS